MKLKNVCLLLLSTIALAGCNGGEDPTSTPSVNPSPSITPSESVKPIPTPSVSPSETPIFTPSETPVITPSETPAPSITIGKKELVSIEASGAKSYFLENEEFSYDDLLVIAHYSDGDSRDVSNYINIDSSEFDNTENGEYTIEVTYTENNITVETSYIVTVFVEDKVMIGTGDKDDPYIISNLFQLEDFRQYVTNTDTDDTYFLLTENLDLKGEEWTPLGSEANPFKGVFIGNNKTISNFKITKFNKSNIAYGFFAYTDGAIISGLKINEYTISGSLLGNDSEYYIGGLVAVANNTYIEGVDINYSDFNIISAQNNGSILIVGGLVAYYNSSSNVFSQITTVNVSGDINVNTEDSDELTDVVAGISAYNSINYTNGAGVVNINACLYQGSILAGSFAGGIAGSISYYCSITECFAFGDNITVTSTDGAQAGGIVAQAYYFSAVMNCVTGFNTIKTESASSSYYASFAGTIGAALSKDQYDDYVDYRGCTTYNNFELDGCTVLADYSYHTKHISKSQIATKLNLNPEIFDLSKEIPTPNFTYDALSQKTVTVAESELEPVVFDTGTYSISLAAMSAIKLEKEHHSFHGLYYDEKLKAQFCWWVPANNDLTLYPGFADLAPLMGSYHFTTNYSTEGRWKFDEEFFIWFMEGDSHQDYSYTFDGKYIFIGELKPFVSGDSGTYGGYEGSIMILNDDGSLTMPDVNEPDLCLYTGLKVDADYQVRTYENKPYLGTWYNHIQTIALYSDAQATGVKEGRAMNYGGFSENEDGTVLIYVFGEMKNTYHYNEEKDVFYGNGILLVRDDIRNYFLTSDNSIIIYQCEGYQTVLINGELRNNDAIVGELVDGETVTINGQDYIVDDHTLKVDEPPLPPTPTEPEVGSTYVGKWSGKVGFNNVELYLYEDGTGKYGDTSFNYSVNENVITFTAGDYDFELTYSRDKQTLTGTASDSIEGYDFDAEFKTYEAFEPAPIIIDSSLVAGTYTGTTSYSAITINTTLVLDENGTAQLTLGEINFTFDWTVSEDGTINISNYVDYTYEWDDLALSFNAKTNQITGLIVYDYQSDYIINLSK